MKGIQIAMNFIVIIVIAVVVIAAIAAFFLSNTFQTSNSVTNQQDFAIGCQRYCKAGVYETYSALYDALKTDKDFVQACTNLGYIQKDSILLQNCLKQCQNCNVDVTQSDINSGYNRIGSLVTGG